MHFYAINYLSRPIHDQFLHKIEFKQICLQMIGSMNSKVHTFILRQVYSQANYKLR